ncbi:MAG: hypothetical protein V4498_00370 [candidate division FCPU426 bacterium]
MKTSIERVWALGVLIAYDSFLRDPALRAEVTQGFEKAKGIGHDSIYFKKAR